MAIYGESVGKNVCARRRLLSLSSLRSGTVVPFKLSDIGEGIRDVTVKEWFVKPGDRVSQFDSICEVQSDKASVTITSRYDGLIKTLHYRVNDVALVGDALVDIELDDDGENRGEEVLVQREKTTRRGNGEEEKEMVEGAGVGGGEGRGEKAKKERANDEEKILATPAVRRIAAENNVQLKNVIATGKDGRVLKEDILAYVEKRSSGCRDGTEEKARNEWHRAEGKTVRLKAYQKHMWKTMTQSLTIPHFGYSDECNVSEVLKYRNEVKDTLKKQGISFTLMPFFIKAASNALLQIAELNGWLDEQEETVRIVERHNIGVAMDTPEGLVVPNIKDVQDRSIISIAKELNRLQELGKKASIPPGDLNGTTFSLSNIGVIGGTYTMPVIAPPQVAIGALGRIQKLPRFDEDGKVIAMDLITVSWAADHRVIDGVTLAKFSNLWKYYVENPTFLMLKS